MQKPKTQGNRMGSIKNQLKRNYERAEDANVVKHSHIASLLTMFTCRSVSRVSVSPGPAATATAMAWQVMARSQQCTTIVGLSVQLGFRCSCVRWVRECCFEMRCAAVRGWKTKAPAKAIAHRSKENQNLGKNIKKNINRTKMRKQSRVARTGDK